MEKKKKIQKIYLTYYDLLIAQGLWQVHYQILNKKYIYIYIYQILSIPFNIFTWKNENGKNRKACSQFTW